MAPFYGENDHPTDDLVPDWLMGGNRKRRVLAALAHPPRGGWTVPKLIDDIGCGRSTAYEIVRGLRALDVLEATSSGGIRLASRAPLGKAIRRMVDALEPYDATSVDRPPRPRDNAPGG
jgi:hypothetical protein